MNEASEFAHGPSTIRLGDLEVTRIGFGAMQLPGRMVWGEPRDPASAVQVLRRVLDHGITLIDSAWYYGPHVSHRLIAETLHPYPRGLVIATKLGGRRLPDKSWAPALRPEELRAGCEDDLRLLRLERVDVCHLRWIPTAGVPFRECVDAMLALQKEGKIRHLALSNVTPALFDEALARGAFVAVQNLYNVHEGEAKLAGLPHAIIEGQEHILDTCAARGMAFLPFFPLAVPGPPRARSSALAPIAARHGVTEAQVAIAWLLARSPAMLPIPGTSSVAHLDENWSARKVALSSEDVAAISAAR